MASLVDRVVSALTYCTFGIFGLIWCLFAWATKKSINSFVMFNIFQSVFLSVLLAVITYAYSILLRLALVIPFVGGIFKSFDLFFNHTPIYFGMALSGFIISALVLYSIVFSLLGQKPFIPFISPIVQSNLRG